MDNLNELVQESTTNLKQTTEQQCFDLLRQCPDPRMKMMVSEIKDTNHELVESVLITGETGTGKELVSRAVHEISRRSVMPFIVLDCTALTPNLIESQLFGHTKGSFTGAYTDHTGFIQRADGGTLFIDEIGELPIAMQCKLLRVLQERTFTRVGSTTMHSSDFRLVASTNRDLEKMVKNESFREDLFYRLNQFPIHVPALRDRPMDIGHLADHYMNKYSEGRYKVTAELRTQLADQKWPGNVRELESFIRREVIVRDRQLNKIEDTYGLPPSTFPQTKTEESEMMGNNVEEVSTLLRRLYYSTGGRNILELCEILEETFIRLALNDCKGNVSAAQKLLGIPRHTLDRKIILKGITFDKTCARKWK